MAGKIYKNYKNKAFPLLILSSIVLSISILLFLKTRIVKLAQAQATPSTITVCPENLEDRTNCLFFGSYGIQQAVNSANSGDQIYIKGGLYDQVKVYVTNKQNIVIYGDVDTTIHSTTGDSQNPNADYIFVIGDSQNITIQNLKLVSQFSEGVGGIGIYGFDSSFTVRSVIIQGNKTKSVYGIALYKGHLILENSTIYNWGIGINLAEVSGMIKKNIITYNKDGLSVHYSDLARDNQAIPHDPNQEIEIINNTFAYNGLNPDAEYEANIELSGAGEDANSPIKPKVTIKNNLITYGKGIWFGPYTNETIIAYKIAYNNIWDANGLSRFIGLNELNNPNVVNNLNSDPLYGENYCLKPGSPAIGSGENGENLGAVKPCDSSFPTGTITPTPFSPNCSTKSQGDTNCDGNIDLEDYYLWKKEFDGTLKSKNADFNGDRLVNLVDFEIWRRSFYQ